MGALGRVLPEGEAPGGGGFGDSFADEAGGVPRVALHQHRRVAPLLTLVCREECVCESYGEVCECVTHRMLRPVKVF